jgi:two-component system phosphate regulon sensor histidine kinase PhoR
VLELVYEVSLATGFQAVLQTLLEQLWEMVPCDGIAVMWLDGEYLKVVASHGSTAPLRDLSLPVRQVGAARAVVDNGRPIYEEDTAGSELGWHVVPGEEGVRAWLGIPLQVDSWTVGLLELTAQTPYHFDEAEVALAAQIAHAAAPLLYRERLLEDARRTVRDRVDPLLSKDTRIINFGADLKPVVHEALEFTRAKHAFIFAKPEGSGMLHCVAASGELRQRIEGMTLRGDGTLGGWSVPLQGGSGRRGAGPSDREIMADLGIKRTLILPLRVNRAQIGMLGVAEPRRRSFGRDALRLMTQLASQASLILERAYGQAPEQDQNDYRAVFQSSPLGVCLLTVAGEIQLCNPALARLLRHSGPGLIGRMLSEFLIGDDAQRLTHALEEVNISGQCRQVDARLRRVSGDNRHVRISLSQSRASQAAGGMLVAILEDVTALKVLEQERVRHLAQLREKHAQLQELDQLKSRFVSNVSHELRTPLAVIKLYATLARKGRPEKQDHYLQTIELETHRLETMVENILDLTRMDRHALHVSPELLAADEIVAQVLQVYEETAQRRGLDLRNHVKSELPLLWADRDHLIQILTNLVDNALKYTPQDGRVWVASRVFEDEGQRFLEIAVGDTGPGIPKAEQELVFERFYRGSSNRPESTGTGLGLAIVRELMAEHKGRVTLQSEAGKGSVFSLHFPLYEGGIPEDVQDGEDGG